MLRSGAFLSPLLSHTAYNLFARVCVQPSQTQIVNHDFNFSKTTSLTITEELQKHFMEDELVVEVWACADPDSRPNFEYSEGACRLI